jgi:ATP-dependent Clp protease protease subunit
MSKHIEAPKPRDLFFTEQVDQSSISDLTKDIVEINRHDEYLIGLYALHGIKYKPEPIKIHIDSYGGYVYQCFGLLSVIENSKTPVHTIVTGCAMSCGFMMLISGHKRFAHKLSTAMYHQVSDWHTGYAEDIKQGLEETERLQSMVEEITLDKTKINKKKLKQIRKEKVDWHMGAEEALKLNVVDEII